MFGNTLQTGGDVYAVTIDIAIVENEITEVQANAELHPIGEVGGSRVLGRCLLDLDGALHAIDGARELGNDAIPSGPYQSPPCSGINGSTTD